MDTSEIAKLLFPFVGGRTLSSSQLKDISMYIDILLRWNARLNLTAVREPQQIVTRHFGESLFAALNLFPEPQQGRLKVVDVGSGAGFPGLPFKLWAPEIQLTLIESNHKKSTFLREVIRGLGWNGMEVYQGRAEEFPTGSADLVTLRAVEHFKKILPRAAALVRPSGRIALLIGQSQVDEAVTLLPGFQWLPPAQVPSSASRVLLVGNKSESAI